MARKDICALKQAPPTIPGSLLSTAKIYSNRREALQTIAPKNGGRYVEVGTMEGYLAAWMKQTLNAAEMVIIDWGKVPYRNCERMKNATAANRAIKTTCLRGDSNALLKTLPDNYFDIVYVDGGHDYLTACGDLESARSKVKPGGYMVINDYFLFEAQFLPKPFPADLAKGRPRYGVYGVIHAVNEFAVRYQWPMVYLAMQHWNQPDVAFQRPA